MLGVQARKQLQDDVQYLNLDELKAFCRRHDLPQMILVERPDGTLARTRDRDRKDIVLDRILEYATSGRRVGATVIPASVAGEGPLRSPLTARTRIRYGQYEKKNPEFVELLERLTDGEFRTGMIARLVLRDFWTAGTAPTMTHFAAAWVEANRAHTEPRPEGAYLVDLARGRAGPEWKAKRNERASRALRKLESLIGARSEAAS